MLFLFTCCWFCGEMSHTIMLGTTLRSMLRDDSWRVQEKYLGSASCKLNTLHYPISQSPAMVFWEMHNDKHGAFRILLIADFSKIRHVWVIQIIIIFMYPKILLGISPSEVFLDILSIITINIFSDIIKKIQQYYWKPWLQKPCP